MPTRKALTLIAGLLMACAMAVPLWASSVGIQRGLGPEPDSLHIHKAQGLAAVNLLRDIREGLVTFDAAGELVPGQAESWEVQDNGKRYRFKLRADARWSNGEPVEAEDFVRAWHRAFTPSTAAPTTGLLKAVLNAEAVLGGGMAPESLGIVAPEPGIVEISLEAPAPWILEILAHPVAFPLHETGLDDARIAPVNGPYTITAWTPRASIRLERNPEYYAADSVRTEVIEYFPIEEPSTELARYRAGELEVTESIPAGRYAWLAENLPDDLRIHPYLGTFWLGLNLQHEALGRSEELRQALSLAINREILVEKVLGAGELPGYSIVPPGIDGYEPSQMLYAGASQEERENEARRLFSRSGFGRGEPLRLELRYNTSGVHRRVAVAVSAMWRQVLGVNTDLVNEEWKVFVSNRRMGVVTEVFRGGWIADYADPASFLDLFAGETRLSGTFYADETYDDLLRKASASVGRERMELLRQAEFRLMRDMPAIPLYYYVSRHLVRPGLDGFVDNVRDIHLSRYLELKNP